jgi:hypothetical protein
VFGLKDVLKLGFLAFALGLPFAGLAVGAFDKRVRDVEDLRRLGISVLGQLRVSNDRAEGYA